MIRFITALAAAAAFATPAVAQSMDGDPMTMTCADYTALQESDRDGLLDALTGGTIAGGAMTDLSDDAAAAGSTMTGSNTAAGGTTAGGATMGGTSEESLSASADISSEQIMMACEGNDDMMLTEAVQQARVQ